MNDKPMKVHWHGAHGRNALYCSGRSVSYTFTTNIPDDVTCKACRRRLVSAAIVSAVVEGN